MRQLVTPGYVPAMRRWFWCVGATVHPRKLLFGSCKHAAGYAANRAEQQGGEVVVVIPGGRIRSKVFDISDRDNGLRVVGCDLL